MVNYLMSYVNKNTALRNLANSDKLFLKFKNNFLTRYKNGVEELTNLVASNDVNGVYDYRICFLIAILDKEYPSLLSVFTLRLRVAPSMGAF